MDILNASQSLASQSLRVNFARRVGRGHPIKYLFERMEGGLRDCAYPEKKGNVISPKQLRAMKFLSNLYQAGLTLGFYEGGREKEVLQSLVTMEIFLGRGDV